MTATKSSRQNDSGSRVSTTHYWENLVLVVVLVSQSKAFYRQVTCKSLLPWHLRGLIISGKEDHWPKRTSNTCAAISSGFPPVTYMLFRSEQTPASRTLRPAKSRNTVSFLVSDHSRCTKIRSFKAQGGRLRVNTQDMQNWRTTHFKTWLSSTDHFYMKYSRVSRRRTSFWPAASNVRLRVMSVL